MLTKKGAEYLKDILRVWSYGVVKDYQIENKDSPVLSDKDLQNALLNIHRFLLSIQQLADYMSGYISKYCDDCVRNRRRADALYKLILYIVNKQALIDSDDYKNIVEEIKSQSFKEISVFGEKYIDIKKMLDKYTIK